MTLNPRAMAMALGLLVGGMMLVVGLANLAMPGYGQAFLDVLASIYPGYNAGGTLVDVIVGTLYGLVDWAIAGWLLAWLYNRFAA
jgi:hypothetical protein